MVTWFGSYEDEEDKDKPEPAPEPDDDSTNVSNCNQSRLKICENTRRSPSCVKLRRNLRYALHLSRKCSKVLSAREMCSRDLRVVFRAPELGLPEVSSAPFEDAVCSGVLARTPLAVVEQSQPPATPCGQHGGREKK